MEHLHTKRTSLAMMIYDKNCMKYLKQIYPADMLDVMLADINIEF